MPNSRKSTKPDLVAPKPRHVASVCDLLEIHTDAASSSPFAFRWFESKSELQLPKLVSDNTVLTLQPSNRMWLSASYIASERACEAADPVYFARPTMRVSYVRAAACMQSTALLPPNCLAGQRMLASNRRLHLAHFSALVTGLALPLHYRLDHLKLSQWQ